MTDRAKPLYERDPKRGEAGRGVRSQHGSSTQADAWLLREASQIP